ncbi:YoaK family protein [Parapedobacter pyrenivorans]|uniref:YoaK family protein n=1 Tax=Parapedobacter pyrenivorans TaxID=1305674 RepID=UPI00333FFE67
MLRHTGPKRTYAHNLRLAILLCLTAGFVNVAGLLAFSILTTNVTGHAALLAIDLESGDVKEAFVALGWLLMFLFGATFSGWYIGFMGKHRRYVYTIPLFIELSVLCFVAYYGASSDEYTGQAPYFAGSLLFVMGMQNALVTMISKSVVRTTHLTGLMTDLGISLSSVIRADFRLNKGLSERLILQGSIVLFFLIGGILGAFCFQHFRYHSFFVPAALLVMTIFFDAFRMGYLKIRHRYRGWEVK